MAGGRVVAAAVALGALAVVALGSHWMMVNAPHRGWAVSLLFGPLLAAVAAAGWQRRHAPTIAGCALAAALLALAVGRGALRDMERLYVLQHAAIHVALGWSFGLTLRPGATPLITALAERVHTRFTPAMREYTRRLTAAWAGYFVAMVVVSLAIYAAAPWSAWSLFCNVATPAAALAFFVGEHAWRHWRHPEFEPATLAAAWRAWRTWRPHGAVK